VDYRQQFIALNALSPCAIKIDVNCKFYVSQPAVEVKRGALLFSDNGRGDTPENAIQAHWRLHTVLEPGEYLVVNAGAPTRAAVRWNGFMWESVREDAA
jgi:hypothetical protein